MVAEHESKGIEQPQKKIAKESASEHTMGREEMLESLPAVDCQGGSSQLPVSKNQIKKQRKLATFELVKKQRRLKERERLKQKKQQALAQGLATRTGPSRKELKKRQQAAGKDLEALSVAIDLDYDELMSDRDISKCVKQCLRMYTVNRRSQRPAHLHFTGLKRNGRIHECLKRNDGWENWHVSYHFDDTHTEAFPKEQLIYLTSESENVLEHLQNDHVYVIGGLVDHNHQKGLCHERATSSNIRTVRLPLSEHVDMKTRTVLCTFHVFCILLHVAEGKSWSEAILETIPQRKGAKLKPGKQQEQQPVSRALHGAEAGTLVAASTGNGTEKCAANETQFTGGTAEEATPADSAADAADAGDANAARLP